MRPTGVALNGIATSGLLGASPWIDTDYFQTPFCLGMLFSISTGATLTATVQMTCDDMSIQTQRPVQGSQTTTVITVTDTGPFQPPSYNGLGGHGLAVGDYVHLFNTGIPSGDGDYTIATVPSATTYTLTSGVSQTATLGPNTTVLAARVFAHPTITGAAARTYASQLSPVMAVRLLIATFTSGVGTLYVNQGMSK